MGADHQLDPDQMKQEIANAETALDDLGLRERRLWDRMCITPEKWAHEQYPNCDSFWVVAILGRRCLYFNFVEFGWGWGRFEKWGQIDEFHWNDLDISHVVAQTIMGIDSGGHG